MFSDIAVAHGVPVRRWTAVVSFSLQAALIAVALVYPLLRMEPLPPVTHPWSLPIFSGFVPVRPAGNSLHAGGPPITQPIVVSNHSISFGHAISAYEGPGIPEPPSIGPYIPGGTGEGLPVVNGYVPPPPPVSVRQTPRTSVMMEGNLIHKVEPQYPPIARQLRLEGSVIIKAWISRDGLIEREQVETGHSLLVRAALDAVRQWRYRPYYLNHEPVEVETEITVNFILQH